MVGEGDNIGPFEAYASFDTELTGLTPYSTMASLSGAQDYFVRGNEIVFGATQAHTLAFIFAKVSYYDYGTTLLVTDGQAGKMTLSGSCQGGYDCGALSTAPGTFGFSYSYYPGTPTTSTVTLAGGADGINITNADLYDDLDEAYTHLNQDFFDIFTVIGARWDSSKETYDAVTGVPITSNAGFADQMRIFLDSFNGELIGVMGFEPLMGWQKSDNTYKQVRLKFDNLEQALLYVEKNKLDYTLIKEKEKKFKIKSYSDNFKYNKL